MKSIAELPEKKMNHEHRFEMVCIEEHNIIHKYVIIALVFWGGFKQKCETVDRSEGREKQPGVVK